MSTPESVSTRPQSFYLSPTQLAALDRFRTQRYLLGFRGEWRSNWSDRNEVAILDPTMNALHARGLINISNASQRSKPKRAALTRLGEYYIAHGALDAITARAAA